MVEREGEQRECLFMMFEQKGMQSGKARHDKTALMG